MQRRIQPNGGRRLVAGATGVAFVLGMTALVHAAVPQPRSAGADAITSGAISSAAAAKETRPLVRDADLSFFFPPQQRDGNAAAAYSRAFEIFGADRERTSARGQPERLLERPAMQAALELITSSAVCRSCDFLPFLPDDMSRTTKFPYLHETQTLARLLGLQFDRLLAAGKRPAALAVARTLMAFGRHLRGSALVLSQDLQGLAIERLATVSFEQALAGTTDAVTLAKLVAVQRLLDGTQNAIADEVASHTTAGHGFTADQAWLRSSHPVLRCEAILNMAQATLPESVLVKPTPSLSLTEIMRTLDQATTGSTVTLRREQFETKIQWPRKGVRLGVTAEDLRVLRGLIEPLAQSDPDGRVRILARRLLDSLGDAAPAPPPRAMDGPTTGARRPLPAPRPLDRRTTGTREQTLPLPRPPIPQRPPSKP